MSEFILTYRKLVMPGDENPAHRLFGGRLMQWADEAAALYAMCQMRSTSAVTLRISEVLFKNPAQSGDILEFWTRTSKTGTTSLGVECRVLRKDIHADANSPLPPQILEPPKGIADSENARLILRCEFIFVHLGKDGKPSPHHLLHRKS